MPDPISIQLYTLRALGDPDRVLDTVAAAGYRNVEGFGPFLDAGAETRKRLDARGLACPTTHVGMAPFREREAAVLDACTAIGAKDLYISAVPPEERDQDGAAWRALGRELAAARERAAKRGIRLGYHNHHWELQPKEGSRTALELLFEQAGKDLIWEVDVAWLVRGNADPKAWITKYRDRVSAAHVKNIAPEGKNLDQDGWADAGDGVLDWKDLWRFCRDAGAEWMVVEHDKPADPAATARNCLNFLRGLPA